MAAPLRRSTRVHRTATSLVSSLHTAAVSTPSTSVSINVQASKLSRKRVKLDADNQTSPSVPRRKTGKAKAKSSSSKFNTAPEDYPTRTELDWKVGAHVSAAGGVENAILNAASIGANAFALFVKSQRKWTSPSLTQESIDLFKSRLRQFDYHPDLVLPHGSYLINIGNPDKDKREKSYECFLDDLKRCEALGLTRYNFHPGSTVGTSTKEESIAHVAECINKAHKETSQIVIVIENMAGSGNILGSKFEEIAQIIELVDDKSRAGACLDTCHTFAAGYDIRTRDTYEAMMSEFDRTIGLQYLRGMHLNDSKSALGSRRDRHQNIGLGELKFPTFSFIMRDPRLKHIPLILETPMNENTEIWKQEIQILNSFCQHSNDDDVSNFESSAGSLLALASATVPKAVKRPKRKATKEIKASDDEDEDEDE